VFFGRRAYSKQIVDDGPENARSDRYLAGARVGLTATTRIENGPPPTRRRQWLIETGVDVALSLSPGLFSNRVSVISRQFPIDACAPNLL